MRSCRNFLTVTEAVDSIKESVNHGCNTNEFIRAGCGLHKVPEGAYNIRANGEAAIGKIAGEQIINGFLK